MNEEEAKKRASEILELDGYADYRFKSISHAEGTNVWEIEAETSNLSIYLALDNDTGNVINKSTANKIVKVVNEVVEHSERVVVTAELFFGLTEPVNVPGVKTESPNIKIVTAEKNPNSIIGFKVKIIDSNEEKIENAYHEIRRLCNYLSIKTGRYIDHRRPEVLITKNGKKTGTKSFTIDAVLAYPLDLNLNDSNVSAIIDDNDPILTQQLSDLASGIKAYDDRNYKDAIRNFWQSIENEALSLGKNYKSLRDGLSHSEINFPDVINDLKNDFGLKLKEKSDSTKTPKGVYIDTNDPNNREILRNEAITLREEAVNLLKNKL